MMISIDFPAHFVLWNEVSPVSPLPRNHDHLRPVKNIGAEAVRAEAVAGAFPKKNKTSETSDLDFKIFQAIRNKKNMFSFWVPNIHQLWFIHQTHWFIHKHFGFDHQIKMSDPSADWDLALKISKNMELLSSNLTQLQNITMFIW